MKIIVTNNQIKYLTEQMLDNVNKFLLDLENLDPSKMKYGNYSFNKEVKMVQIALTFLGLNPETNIDGKFGPVTLKALEKFIKNNQIKDQSQILPKMVDMIDNSPRKDELKTLLNVGKLKVGSKKIPVTKIEDGNKIVKFFVSKGLSPEQAAGIAGNLYIESGFNTDALGDGGTSYGIAQWHKERKNGLFNWVRSKGLDVKNLGAQLQFLWKELNTTEVNALNKLKQTDSPSEAAASFAKYFERPASKDYSNRSGAAETIYSSYAGYKFY